MIVRPLPSPISQRACATAKLTSAFSSSSATRSLGMAARAFIVPSRAAASWRTSASLSARWPSTNRTTSRRAPMVAKAASASERFDALSLPTPAVRICHDLASMDSFSPGLPGAVCGPGGVPCAKALDANQPDSCIARSAQAISIATRVRLTLKPFGANCPSLVLTIIRSSSHARSEDDVTGGTAEQAQNKREWCPVLRQPNPTSGRFGWKRSLLTKTNPRPSKELSGRRPWHQSCEYPLRTYGHSTARTRQKEKDAPDRLRGRPCDPSPAGDDCRFEAEARGANRRRRDPLSRHGE